MAPSRTSPPSCLSWHEGPGLKEKSAPALGSAGAGALGQPVSRVLSGVGCGLRVSPSSRSLRLGDHLSGPRRHRPARAAYPGLNGWAPIAPVWPCSKWGLPGRQHCCQRRWSLTPPFHPYPRRSATGRSFSVALSAGHPARVLPGTLPDGARTFLGRHSPPAVARPAQPCFHHTGRGCLRQRDPASPPGPPPMPAGSQPRAPTTSAACWSQCR
jgi:hypothetical protein